MKIDFHTHILPGTDDGARDLDTSLEMLTRLGKQGIELVVLTPHYYLDDNTIEEFEKRRGKAYCELLEKTKGEQVPSLLLGSEVRMWRDMSLCDLSPLCIEGTNLLLCEMPFTYKCYLPDEFEELVVSGYVPVVAHIDRYFKLFDGKDMKKILDLEGVIFQVNTESLSDFFTRYSLLSMAKEGGDFLLGTDCHDLGSRKPDIKPRVLKKHCLKKYFLPSVQKNEEMLLELQ